MSSRYRCLTLAVVTLSASWAARAVAADASKVGVVSNIKVLSDKVEDVTTLAAWKKTYIRDGMSEKEKLLEDGGQIPSPDRSAG
jgi:hypothetical protein